MPKLAHVSEGVVAVWIATGVLTVVSGGVVTVDVGAM